jgi:hypothetical protein
MRKVSIAESILSLFARREFAASIAGDLGGDAASGFWANVLITAFALFF